MLKSRHLFFTLLYITLTQGRAGLGQQVKLAPQRSDDQSIYLPTKHDDGVGELAYANSDGTQVVFTNTSHKIDATGWTFTSPLWPSIETTQPQSDSTKWFEMVEPFIYADKARSIDYSLLLYINNTTLETLKNYTKPLSINLSFEYYFNHDPKINKPGIKVEIDRKQFRYLEVDGEQNGARKWLNFDEKISITDSTQIENPDWLKISLVNRQSPSLVAIRRLKVELSSTLIQSSSKNPTVAPSTSQAQPIATASNVATPSHLQESTKAQIPLLTTTPERNPTYTTNPTPTKQASPLTRPATVKSKDKSQRGPQQAPVEYAPNISNSQDEVEEAVEQDYATTVGPDDTQTPAASRTLLNGRIKPVEPRKSSWWGKKRKRRDVTTTDLPISIVLTCYRSDKCDWKAESNEVIQWSLARQPPSTDTVQSGYYYMSNRNSNYSDSTKLLKLSLNRSDSATFNDQKADHCIDLAIYVTEKAYLKLYKLTKSSNDNEWNKGNLLMIWVPTMATKQAQGLNSSAISRISLPNSKLTAMENGQNGWTVEQLCFGDFFVDNEEYNSGKSAFGFEMESDAVKQHMNIFSPDQVIGRNKGQSSDLETSEISASDETPFSVEQVVAVSLLQEYARNVHLDGPRTWLETWQKDLIQPNSDWTFYPKSDYQINPNNVTFLNLFDDAHYHIESKWISIDQYLDFNATISLDLDLSGSGFNASMFETNISQILSKEGTTSMDGDEENLNKPLFEIGIVVKLVDSKFDSIYTNHSLIDWSIKKNSSHIDLRILVTDLILEARHGELKRNNDDNLFKIILEFVLDCHSVDQASLFYKFAQDNNINYRVTLANVSLSDRCFPSPCQFGSCGQIGTGYEDWKCDCDERRRGRRCQLGQWCKIDHVTPYVQPPQGTKLTLKPNNPQQYRQPKFADNNIVHISGEEYCKRKFGLGSNCTNIDLPLNENFYSDEGETFDCSCKDDFYLDDHSKCKQVHLCNSIICPSLGMICDENKPFNRTQPCHCNEKQDWYQDPTDVLGNKCIRGQCQDKRKNCGFNAHICLPTSVGEKPICKCGPKFSLKIDDKGNNYCKSTACVLPTLNNCQQICIPDNKSFEQPYTCACHPGFDLQQDGHSCEPSKPRATPICRPACDKKTQICTEVGCKCKQGYIGEGEHSIQRIKSNHQQLNQKNGPENGNSKSIMKYVESVTCLNVCSLSYAENKEQFEMIESVCPLGLCDSDNFKCRCSDPTSSALINTKYEPIYSNFTVDGEEILQRKSPLCQLKRVCDINSSNYKICKAKGAICVPDYSKPEMFDCVCPPSTEKKILGLDVNSDFKCEQKCNSKKYDCIRRQAICKLVDKDKVECDCPPGLMLEDHDKKCYLAKHSYAFNLIIVNRYYEPESKFHKLNILNNTESSNSHDAKLLGNVGPIQQTDIDQEHHYQILPQYYKTNSIEKPLNRSIFISNYNQCNVTQIIPKSVIEDTYEHDMESFLSYIDQCNQDIHLNIKNYRLNSYLKEDLQRALRQHIKNFTVTTSNDSCVEIDQDGMYLNCTIYLQANEPIPSSTVEYVFNNCDKHGESDKHCWIKPRLLLKKVTGQASSNETMFPRNELNFSQIIPCEINNFCGNEAISVRDSNSTSLCSCRCPPGIEVIDVKDLQARPHEDEQSSVSVKEVCAKANLCVANSTLCLPKVGSICKYDVNSGSKCMCEFPFYENSSGQCVEGESGRLHIALIIVVIVLGIALIISLAVNIEASTRSKRLFGRSKQYPLNDFPISRSTNRSTGVPNPVFTND